MGELRTRMEHGEVVRSVHELLHRELHRGRQDPRLFGRLPRTFQRERMGSTTEFSVGFGEGRWVRVRIHAEPPGSRLVVEHEGAEDRARYLLELLRKMLSARS